MIKKYISKANDKTIKSKKLKKKLKFKYFVYDDNNELQTFFIRPKDCIKFFEFRLPLESTFLEEEQSKRSEMRVLIDFTDFRRISKITYDSLSKEY